MRQLARYESEPRATAAADVLYAEGIDTKVDALRDGGYALWVHDESLLTEARSVLDEYERDPEHPRYAKAQSEAKARRATAEREHAEYRRRSQRAAQAWRDGAAERGSGAVALGLVVACVAFSIATGFGEKRAALSLLLIADPAVDGFGLRALGSAMSRFEFWRLITPIFPHGGALHLVMNGLWLFSFGTAIERVESSMKLGLLVLVSAVVSNVAQLAIGDSPRFLGFSGVNYALFGYIWLLSIFAPLRGYVMSGTNVFMLLAWFVMCFVGAVGDVANWAHAGGLVVGAAWAYLEARVRKS